MDKFSETENNTQPTPEKPKPPKDDFTAPWREPTYTSTSVYVRAYSPGRYDTRGFNPPKKRKKKSYGRVLSFVLLCAVVCGISGGSAAYFVTNKMINEYHAKDNTTVVLGAAETEINRTADEAETVDTNDPILTAEEIYSLACNQVVGINTSVTTNVFGQTSSSAVSGSGFIISEDGYILTNYHVVEYAATYGYEMTVMLYDGTSFTGEVVGWDADNDVAVVKINATGLKPVTLGSSENMKVGEQIYAVGNPLGELEFTMTGGMISALDRYVSTASKTSLNMFQIDAAVNSGNSGGPVYNQNGEVIGIVTAKYSSAGVEGLGFAIPINDAINISTQLIEHGYVSGKAYLGINAQDITDTYSYYLNLPRGAYVYYVNNDSCAIKAGVKVGDVITAIDDYSVESTRDLKSALGHYSAGDSAKITVYRSGESLVLTITFDERSRDADKVQKPQNDAAQGNLEKPWNE